MAALLIANLAPIVLLSGVVGRLVDLRDNRRFLIVSSLAQAVICAGLASVTGSATVLVLVALLGIGQAVNGATWQALVPSLVGPDELARALGRMQAATTVAGIGAPALSGLLTGLCGAGAVADRRRHLRRDHRRSGAAARPSRCSRCSCCSARSSTSSMVMGTAAATERGRVAAVLTGVLLARARSSSGPASWACWPPCCGAVG